jgi:hypothetical protein
MALNKSIKSGREHRKEYIGKNYCKSVDTRCCNHGGRRHQKQCEWCLGNRIYKNRAKENNAKQEILDYYK